MNRKEPSENENEKLFKFMQISKSSEKLEQLRVIVDITYRLMCDYEFH